MKFLLSLPGLLTAIIFHELAHGYVAYRLGDNTAKDAGRLTLNPLKHIDPIGFISMVIFKFGWAKPVPVDSRNFKNRKSGMILVAIAGPISNFILAIIIGFIISFGIIRNQMLYIILIIGLQYNIMLGVFNLLPFPPLDGSKILASLLPLKWEYYFYKYERYLYILLLILIAKNGIDNILTPLINKAMNILVSIVF